MSINITEAKNMVTELMAADLPVILWGPAGIGKTSIVHQLSDELGLPEWEIILSSREPTDLSGLPRFPDNDATQVDWVAPSDIPFIGVQSPDGVTIDEDYECILFIDEFSTSVPAMQNVALQLLQERRVGPHRLPKGVRIILAANKASHGAHVTRLSAPAKNRMLHLHVDASWNESSRPYFTENGFRSEIIGYLDTKPDMLNVSPEGDVDAFATPRSWEMCNTVLNATFGEEPVTDYGKMLRLASMAVGTAAHELVAYTKLYDKVDAVKVLTDGVGVEWDASEASLKFAAASAVANALFNRVGKITDTHLKNLVKFYGTLDAEFGLYFHRCADWSASPARYKVFERLIDLEPEFAQAAAELVDIIS